MITPGSSAAPQTASRAAGSVLSPPHCQAAQPCPSLASIHQSPPRITYLHPLPTGGFEEPKSGRNQEASSNCHRTKAAFPGCGGWGSFPWALGLLKSNDPMAQMEGKHSNSGLSGIGERRCHPPQSLGWEVGKTEPYWPQTEGVSPPPHPPRPRQERSGKGK